MENENKLCKCLKIDDLEVGIVVAKKMSKTILNEIDDANIMTVLPYKITGIK